MMEVGRMAVVRDPTGAVFALWAPALQGRGHYSPILLLE